MLTLSRWKVLLVVLSVVRGVLFALPNALPKEVRDDLPGFLPKQTLNLGLDLQGGLKVPFAVQDLQPVGTRIPRLADVTVRFGSPLHVTGQYDGVPPGRARREITDRVMTEIQKLTGQEMAGVYNERPPTV